MKKFVGAMTAGAMLIVLVFVMHARAIAQGSPRCFAAERWEVDEMSEIDEEQRALNVRAGSLLSVVRKRLQLSPETRLGFDRARRQFVAPPEAGGQGSSAPVSTASVSAEAVR